MSFRTDICLLLTSLVVLAGCATMPERVRPDVRSIGVVSLLSDKIEAFYFGKFFDGYSHDRQLDGAGFDEIAERMMETRLRQSRPGATVKRIRLEKDDLIRESNRGLLSMYNADVGDIRAALRPWAAQNNVDVIVIVRQLNQAVPIQAPQSNFRGLGLYASFSVRPPQPVASFGVTVWDGKTLDFISESSVFLIGYDRAGTYSLEKEMEENFSGERRGRLVDTLRALVAQGTPALLSQVGL